jgi:hypothetical protein
MITCNFYLERIRAQWGFKGLDDVLGLQGRKGCSDTWNRIPGNVLTRVHHGYGIQVPSVCTPQVHRIPVHIRYPYPSSTGSRCVCTQHYNNTLVEVKVTKV